MSKKRLQKDYRLEFASGEDGKETAKITYVGGTYVPEKPEKSKVFGILFVLISIINAVLFILPLCFHCDAFFRVYFVLPYVLRIFCIAYLCRSAFFAVTKKPPYREKEKAVVFDNAKVACVIGELLSVFALVSFAVYLLTDGAKGSDYLAVGCCMAETILFFLQYLNIRRYTLKPITTEDPVENKPEQTKTPDKE